MLITFASMKHLFSYCLLSAALFVAACSKKDDPTNSASSNDLLGHWEAESIQETNLTASGQISNQTTTQQYKSELDVAETGFDQTIHPKDKKGTLVHFGYQRVGDTLKLTLNRGGYKHVLVRSLTPTALTLEQQMDNFPGTYIRQIYYHR
jgi:hypothetical protein